MGENIHNINLKKLSDETFAKKFTTKEEGDIIDDFICVEKEEYEDLDRCFLGIVVKKDDNYYKMIFEWDEGVWDIVQYFGAKRVVPDFEYDENFPHNYPTWSEV